MIRSYCTWGLITLVVASAQADEWAGWQGFRVIHQEGAPGRMFAADLDGSGRGQLVVVNGRQSRLDLYAWLPKDKRTAAVAADPQRPNELPLAPEWTHRELPLDDLPAEALACDVDGDKRPELLVLSSPTNKVLVFGQEADGWKKLRHWDLLPGTASGRRAMLLRSQAGGKPELLVSFDQGIQTLSLEPNSRPSWLLPREQRGRLDWKLADLDGDGDADVLEWTSQPRQAVRWYECAADKLLPAQVLHEQAVQGLEVLSRPGKSAEVLLLGGAQDGMLRRYQMVRGEQSELGRQEALPIAGGAKAPWCGIRLDDSASFVAVDGTQPRLRVHALTGEGWGPEQSYPTISGVKGLAAPAAEPGLLLLWAKDGSDLHASRWEAGRLSYPRVFAAQSTVADRKIIALDGVGRTVWWVQRAGPDLELYTWSPTDKQPRRTTFAGLGSKVEKAMWLGGQRLLVQQAYSTSAKLGALVDGKLLVTEPSHLGKVDLAEFALFERGENVRLGRYTDGVLQWLDDNLQPIDQVMLPDGQRLASFVPLDEKHAWALEAGGLFVHRLEADGAGIFRVAKSIKPPQGSALWLDPVLGLLLLDQERIVHLSPGRLWELKLIESIDSRVGRPSGVREATIHRCLTADVSGDGQDEVVLCDDRRHQLTVLQWTEKGLTPLISWQVFEDQAYPYGGETGDALVPEPRLVTGFDADGDGRQDLALICHDRLLVYLAREEKGS